MFTGLSAFPLTPIAHGDIDERGFLALLQRLTDARVHSLGILGSTGSYAYLTRKQRHRVAMLAKQHAEGIPMMVCVGAVSMEQVFHLADDAQQAGADALLLPAVSYQPLTDDEAYAFFADVTRRVSVPVCIYDNPGTTHFTFSDALHGRLAALPGIASIKIPGVPTEPDAAAARVRHLRETIPENVTIGISGDAFAGVGLNAGCEVWYSVCGGLFPRKAKAITDAALCGDRELVTKLTGELTPLWDLFRKHNGSLRVIAAAAGILGLTERDCLPRPLLSLSATAREEVAQVITKLALA